MRFGDGDLPALFAEMGVSATYLGETAPVIFDEAEEVTEDAMGGELVPHGRVIEFPAKQFPTIAAETEIVVDGVTYLVRDPRLLDDGATRRVNLIPLS